MECRSISSTCGENVDFHFPKYKYGLVTPGMPYQSSYSSLSLSKSEGSFRKFQHYKKNLSFFSVYKFFSLLFTTQMVFRWNSTKPQDLYPSGFPRHQLHIGAPNPPNSANSGPRICPRRCSQDHFHCKKVIFQNHVMFIFSNKFILKKSNFHKTYGHISMLKNSHLSNTSLANSETVGLSISVFTTV